MARPPRTANGQGRQSLAKANRIGQFRLFMPFSTKATGVGSGTILAWQILAPVAALFALLVIFSTWWGQHHFQPLALQRDLLRAERYAKFSAVVFAERLPEKTPGELSEEFWSAGLDTLEFLPPGQIPAWSSPRYVAAGPFVEAWSPVTGADGSPMGAIRIRRQADSLVFVTQAVRTFAIASCLTFALLFALAWFLFKRRVTDRLDAIIRETATIPPSEDAESDTVERTREAIGQALTDAKNSAEHMRRLLDGQSELGCVATPEGQLVDANDAYCRFFGKKREELVGTSCLDLVHPAYRTDVVNQLRSLSTANPEENSTHVVIKFDGSTAWVKWHTASFADAVGKTKEVISFMTDITAQKDSEEQLAGLRRAFDQMQSLAETGSLTWDFGRDQMDWTPETRRLLGISASTVESLDELLAVIVPEDREAMRQLFLAARGKGKEFDHEFCAILPNGSLRVLQSRAEVLADPKTKLLTLLTCTLRDITSLRDAEAATKHELRLREAIEQSLASGVVVSDPQGTNILVNPSFCAMTGWTNEELIGKQPPYPYWPEEEIPAISAAFEQALRGETPKEGFELKFRRKDGSRFDVLVQVAPLLDSEDRRIGWLGAVTDISSIQQTRRELAQTGQELRRQLSYREALDKSTTVGLIALDEEGLPFAANEAYCRMLGYTEAEIMRFAPPYPYWPEEEREKIEEAFALHLEGKTPSEGFQLRFRKKNGALIDVLVTAASISGPDGRRIGVLSALTDITPLQETRRELITANERLQIAQDVMGLGLWDWDPFADTLFWDKNSFAIFGHPDENNPKEVWTAALGEEERERLTHELVQLMAAGGADGQDRLRLRWPDGTEHNVLSTYVILRDKSGKATRVVGVNRDITAELEEERELRNARERLTAALEGGEYGTFEHIIGHGDVNWNAANYEINGIDPSVSDPAELFKLWKQSAGEFFPELVARMNALPTRQQHINYEFIAHPPGKEPRRVRTSTFIERNKHGHPTRLVGISRRID